MKLPWVIIRHSKLEDMHNKISELRGTLRGMTVVAAQTQAWFEREQMVVAAQKKTIEYLRGKQE